MKVLILGLGSIAQKHIHVLKELEPKVQLYALRSSENSDKQKGVTNLFTYEELRQYKFNFVLISSPSSIHWDQIFRLQDLNIPMMIEKPLFINKDQIEAFEKSNNNWPLMYVACNFRFHPLIKFIKTYLEQNPSKINEINAYCGSFLPDWRPGKDYTKVYSAIRELGGGVHLDLIHEIDYLVYLFGLPLSSISKKRKASKLEINSFDSSMNILEFNSFQAQVTLNYFRKDTKRNLEIVREKDTLYVDFLKGEITNLLNNELLFKAKDMSIFVTYKEQMAYFLECIDKNKSPMNSPNEAIAVLKCVL